MTRPRRHRPGKRVLVCPQCRSPRIVPEGGTILGQIYHCLACQYVGALVLEIYVAEDGTPPG